MRGKRFMTRKPSPFDIYGMLPRTNCGKCGESNCLAFSTKVANRETSLDKCSPLLTGKYGKSLEQLKEMLRPVVREVIIGSGKRAVKIGGKSVMYRHELSYSNPTVIAVDVADELPEDGILERVRTVERFGFEYIGQILKLDSIAVRSTSGNPEKFKKAVMKVTENTDLPLVLCSPDPEVLKAGLEVAFKSRPLLFAATKDNWERVAQLALEHDCPLVVSAPGDVGLLRSLVKALLEHGVEDLVLDSGSFPGNGLANTLNNLTAIRRAVFKKGDRLLSFPLVSVPMTVWTDEGAGPEEIATWKEACFAAMMIVRFADILILHGADGWALLPLVVLRQNLYTDPRKPASVKPGLRVFGAPNEESPVMFTSNFALTYYTVASDIESAKMDAYLVVVDTDGIAVDSAVAGRKLTAEKVARALKTSNVEGKVKHRRLIIPGKAARLSQEIEKTTGWKVLVGPKDSSDIPKFLQQQWGSAQ